MSRFWRVLRNLLLAMINATLILVALCLWLVWQLTSEVNSITDDVTTLRPLQPLRDDVTALTGEIRGLRAEIAAAGDELDEGQAAAQALQRLAARADQLEAQLTAIVQRSAAVVEDPDQAIARATAVAAGVMGDELQALAGCYAQPDPPAQD